jgi:hypothetical protein
VVEVVVLLEVLPLLLVVAATRVDLRFAAGVTGELPADGAAAAVVVDVALLRLLSLLAAARVAGCSSAPEDRVEGVSVVLATFCRASMEASLSMSFCSRSSTFFFATYMNEPR